MRKKYKKNAVAITKAKSHLSFVSSCKDRQQMPKGLKVNVRCSAFLASYTDVKDCFSETSNKAEGGFVSHLNNHYEEVVKQLDEKQAILTSGMASLENS